MLLSLLIRHGSAVKQIIKGAENKNKLRTQHKGGKRCGAEKSMQNVWMQRNT